MGDWGDIFADTFDYECFVEDMDNAYERHLQLSKMNNQAFLMYMRIVGECLNNVTEHFPAYSVVVKLLDNHWTATPKQRHAIENVYLWHLYSVKLETLKNNGYNI